MHGVGRFAVTTRRRGFAVLAAGFLGVVCVLPAAQAGAAPRPQIVDAVGDANGLNDQATGVAVPSRSTGADDATADITGITFQTTFTRQPRDHRPGMMPSGARVTMTLAAPPDHNTGYEVSFTSSTGCRAVTLRYDVSPVPESAGRGALCFDTNPGSTIDGVSASLVGNSVVWQLPLRVFPAGDTFTGIGGRTWTSALAVVELDGTDPSAFTFTVGR